MAKCCSFGSADAEVRFPLGVNLNKNSGDADDLPLFLLPSKAINLFNCSTLMILIKLLVLH